MNASAATTDIAFVTEPDESSIRPANRPTAGTLSIASHFGGNDVLRAEIIFTLWSIGQQHNLYSSSDGFAKVLAAMVPDSAIAKAFSLEKDKTRYMTQFGIAPIAKTLII